MATQLESNAIGSAAEYVLDFEERASSFSGPGWASSLMRRAIDAFAASGFPTRHNEDWRFTPLAAITEQRFTLAGDSRAVTASEIERVGFGDLGGHRIVLVDGVYSAELSSILPSAPGVRVQSLAAALADDDVLLQTNLAQFASIDANPFVALNTAFLSGGAVIIIPRGTVVVEPIHILSVATAPEHATVAHPRVLMLAGESSQATVVESYETLGDGITWTNAVTEFVVGENAAIEHYKIHREGDRSRHVATTHVQLARSATFVSQNVTMGGLLTRNDINAVLGGEGVSCTLNGLFLAGGDQIVDNHTAIDHAMPHCESHELYKGILDGKSRGVFNGKIFVRPDAQKTDAKQTNKTLLLSPTARIDTKPQLEIYADDVKCTHGATVGQPDDEAIFYLRSRGIGELDARNLMTYAFASDIIGRIKIEAIRRELDSSVLSAGMLQATGESI